MGLFGIQQPFDAEIEKATSETNTSEPWDVILDITDKVNSNPVNSKDCLKSIMKRLAHNDPHVVVQAITVLDSCVNNCGKTFHLEVASREFENEFKRLLSKSQPQVALKMRLLLKRWVEGEFKNDPQLNLIPSMYAKLKSEGNDFTDTSQPAAKPKTVYSKDPNVVSSQQEEEDIAKAIELSLKEKSAGTTGIGGSPKVQSATLYPSMSLNSTSGGNNNSGGASTQHSEARKVLALYDFEAAEDNELTFLAGEIIHVLDDSDTNWWKGYNQRGEGLFPSNFVTADLSAEPESLRLDTDNKKSMQHNDEVKKDEEQKLDTIEINEEKIDRLLHLLHEANPEDPSQDSEEMLRLETNVNQMGPLIDAELERVDQKHAQLTQLSSVLVDAMNLYHTLMREPAITGYMPTAAATMYGQPPTSMAAPPTSMYGGANIPPGMFGIAGMYTPGALPPQQQMQSLPPQMVGQHQQNQQQPQSLGPQQLPPSASQQHGSGAGMQLPPQQQMAQMSLGGGAGGYNMQQQPPQQQQMIPPQLHNGHTVPITQPQMLQQPIPMQVGHPGQMQQPPQQQQPQHHPQAVGPPQQQQPPQQQSGNFPQPHPSNHFQPIPQQNAQSLPPHQMMGQMFPMQQHPHNMGPMHMPISNMAAINQPVTNTILPPGGGDPKMQIPIYQQQR